VQAAGQKNDKSQNQAKSVSIDQPKAAAAAAGA
jgi:hypothetical protein